MCGGKVAVEEARLPIVMLKLGEESRAARMGAPTEPEAPSIRIFLRGAVVILFFVFLRSG